MYEGLSLKNGRYLYEGKEFCLTVKQLHKHLAKLIKDGHGDDYVVSPKDEEGNGFNILHPYITPGFFDVEQDDFVTIDDDREEEEEEKQERLATSVKCICVG